LRLRKKSGWRKNNGYQWKNNAKNNGNNEKYNGATAGLPLRFRAGRVHGFLFRRSRQSAGARNEPASFAATLRG
jgi:hypothetical protein